MQWDDLRYYLELARTGRLSHAGERLNVDHTTVARRIENLEKSVGCKLFEQDRRGYRLSEAGHRLLSHAESIENIIAIASEELSGAKQHVGGVVRIGAPEGFGSLFLAPRLNTLLEANPGLDVQLISLPRFANLAAHEADMIVTLDPPQGGRYVTAKLTDFTYGLYASREYLNQVPPIRSAADLADKAFIGYIEDYQPSAQWRYLEELHPGLKQRFAASGMLSQVQAVRSGLGIAVLAHYLVDDPNIQAVLPDQAVWKRTFWLATHADWWRLRRVQTVWRYIRSCVEASPQVFMSIE